MKPRAEVATMAPLARRLRRLGLLLLAGGLAAFVWAVGFSRGVDGLLEGLVIAVAGFLLPAVALLWVAYVLASASDDAAFELPLDDLRAKRGGQRLGRIPAYLVAVAAVALALVVREWLTPYMSSTMISPTFLLAITVSAWVGGMGPAVLATAASVPTLWYVFLRDLPRAAEGTRTGDLVGLALFATVALSIAGIASALRITQSRSARLRADMRAGAAALDESEVRFREAADEAPAMIWMSGPDGRRTFFNRAWLDSTGRTQAQEAGDGWIDGVHPQDLRNVTTAIDAALQHGEAFRAEYRLRGSDGDYRRVVDQGRPRIDRDGRFVGFIGAAVDLAGVAERRRTRRAQARREDGSRGDGSLGDASPVAASPGGASPGDARQFPANGGG